MKNKIPYTTIGVIGIALTIALITSYLGSLSTVRLPEWDNYPLEQKQFIEEQIAIQGERADKAMKTAKILREIRDEMLDSHGLQVKTVVLEDVVEVKQPTIIPTVSAGELTPPTDGQYLTQMGLASWQVDQVLEHRVNVRNPDHFIAWFGAIFRHENGGSFIDGETNYLNGRLKKDMKYKPFKEQLDGRVEAYNKYRYKHDNVNGWINVSRYCVSDYHGGKQPGCPNRKRNVANFLTMYGKISMEQLEEKGVYKQARAKQEEADVLWKKCKEVGECSH